MVKIVAMGDNVVDCYVSNGMMYPGGNTLNVAVFVSRFGGQTAYVGRVADDVEGQLIRNSLVAEGVDVARLQIAREGSTAYCVINHQDGDRVFQSFDLGVSMFSPSKSDLDFIAGFDAAQIGKSSGIDGTLKDVSALTRLSYDFSTSHDALHIQTVAPLCFLATASGGDLTESEALALQRRILDAGAKWVLITRGKAGALLSDGSVVFSAAAVPTDVVDTLGAGDTFIARTLYGLLDGEEPDELLKAAARAAADTCRNYGAFGHGTPIDIGHYIKELAIVRT